MTPGGDAQPIVARAPGRVVLIGDHTDYTGGLVCAMAIDRWTTVTAHLLDGRLRVRSADEPVALDIPCPVADARRIEPAWGRYVAGVAAQMHCTVGLDGEVSTTIPIGAGLSSSAALELATALALGFDGTAEQLARMCQRAENEATGLPSGILDQLTSACGVEGHALVLDCSTLERSPVRIPEGAQLSVRFVAHRQLVGSPYADRVAACAAAETEIGPLRLATLADLAQISNPEVRRRARHVITENQRVRDFSGALATGDLKAAGALMQTGHASLRDDYDTSTPAMDAAVAELCSQRGVYGARMTGGGFGGCVVILSEPGVISYSDWVVRPVDGAARIN